MTKHCKMELRTVAIPYSSCNLDELEEDARQLVLQARQATYLSYAPYSNFYVGAAVRVANGAVIMGSNQENVAFPSGICAERCAMFYANSAYPDVAPVSIAIAARGRDGKFTAHPISPCGACRQVLLEAQIRYGKPLEILLSGMEEVYVLKGVGALLPFQFDSLD